MTEVNIGSAAVDFDQHLVLHDLATLGIASINGLVGVAVTDSPANGLLVMGSTIMLGIVVMRIGPLRRAINRTAFAIQRTTGRSHG